MKALSFARAFGAAFALVLVGFLAGHAGSVLPLPSASGPSLGDPTTNLYSVTQALQNNTTSNFFSFTTITVAAGQTTSTQLQPGFNFLTAAVGVTPTMALPTAKPGSDIQIINNTGVGLALFGSATPFTPGGQDYINNVIGNTLNAGGSAYGVGNGKVAQCVVPQGGNWWCVTGN